MPYQSENENGFGMVQTACIQQKHSVWLRSRGGADADVKREFIETKTFVDNGFVPQKPKVKSRVDGTPCWSQQILVKER